MPTHAHSCTYARFLARLHARVLYRSIKKMLGFVDEDETVPQSHFYWCPARILRAARSTLHRHMLRTTHNVLHPLHATRYMLHATLDTPTPFVVHPAP